MSIERLATCQGDLYRQRFNFRLKFRNLLWQKPTITLDDKMRLLDRYLLRELLVPLGYCLGGFLIFWIAFDLFAKLGEFQDRGLKFKDILEYYLISAPELLVTVIPVALLLGLLYALTSHARYNELTAIRAAGISLWRLSLPYLVVGFILSCLLFAANELWVPEAQEKAEVLMERYETKSSDTSSEDWKKNLYFRNERERRSWSIEAYNLKTSVMSNILINWEPKAGELRNISAMRGSYSNGAWILENVSELYRSTNSLYPQKTTNAMLQLELSETPELIKSEVSINNLSLRKAGKRAQVPLKDLANYFHLHPTLSGTQKALLKTQFHGRIATPWTCLIVVLIAIPFGAPSGRRNVFVGVASSIFLCFAFFILQRMGLIMGTAGTMPPWLAAWLPNIVFAATGIWLTLRVR